MIVLTVSICYEQHLYSGPLWYMYVETCWRKGCILNTSTLLLEQLVRGITILWNNYVQCGCISLTHSPYCSEIYITWFLSGEFHLKHFNRGYTMYVIHSFPSCAPDKTYRSRQLTKQKHPCLLHKVCRGQLTK